MKKLLICICGLLLIAFVSFQASARMNVGMVGGGVPAGGGPDTWYYADDSSSGTGYVSANQARGARVTIGSSGTATQLKIVANGNGGTANAKVAIWTYPGSGYTYTLAGYCSSAIELENGAAAEKTCNLDRNAAGSTVSGIAVSATEEYYVTFAVDANSQFTRAVSAYRMLSNSATYSTYPQSTQGGDEAVETDQAPQVGIYVD